VAGQIVRALRKLQRKTHAYPIQLKQNVLKTLLVAGQIARALRKTEEDWKEQQALIPHPPQAQERQVQALTPHQPQVKIRPVQALNPHQRPALIHQAHQQQLILANPFQRNQNANQIKNAFGQDPHAQLTLATRTQSNQLAPQHLAYGQEPHVQLTLAIRTQTNQLAQPMHLAYGQEPHVQLTLATRTQINQLALHKHHVNGLELNAILIRVHLFLTKQLVLMIQNASLLIQNAKSIVQEELQLLIVLLTTSVNGEAMHAHLILALLI